MRRLRAESGVALVTAMLIMSIIGASAIVALYSVDRYQRETGEQRVRESAFQLAQTAMDAQVVPLGSAWPASATGAVPAACVSTTPAPRCPDAATLAAAFPGTDAQGGSWTVEVRDDIGVGLSRYDRAALQTLACAGVAPCTWDSNGNGRLWIRSRASALGRERSVVAMIRRQPVRVAFPRASVIAGYFATTNNGNKVLVDERGCSEKLTTASPTCAANQPAPILVRCTTTTPGPDDPCIRHREGQISPPVTDSFTGELLPEGAVDALRVAAQAANSYYTSCPDEAQLTGKNVFIEGVSCSFSTSRVINSPEDPGRIVVHRGAISFGGSLDIYGLVLATNGMTPGNGVLVTVSGDATIQGAVFIEGGGGLALGSSNLNLNFDERALEDLVTWGLPAFEHHSFRELTPGE